MATRGHTPEALRHAVAARNKALFAVYESKKREYKLADATRHRLANVYLHWQDTLQSGLSSEVELARERLPKAKADFEAAVKIQSAALSAQGRASAAMLRGAVREEKALARCLAKASNQCV